MPVAFEITTTSMIHLHEKMNILFFCIVVSQTVHLEGISETILDGFKFRLHKFAVLLKEVNIYTSDLLVRHHLLLFHSFTIAVCVFCRRVGRRRSRQSWKHSRNSNSCCYNNSSRNSSLLQCRNRLNNSKRGIIIKSKCHLLIH